MPYAEGRTIHDADSHVMETPDWFSAFADPGVRERIPPLFVATVAPGEESFIGELRRKHQEEEFRARDAEEIMLRKNWKATGSFLKEDRPRALDLLGFASQLVFNTFANGALCRAEQGDDVDYAYGLARAHNRAMVDFCSVDPRLLAVGYVPLADFERARAMAREAVDMGCAALMVASACPRGHSPSHTGLDPVWAVAQESGRPVLFHVGGGGRRSTPSTSRTGCRPCPTSTAGPRTSAPSTTWPSPTRPCRPWRP
jgi:predicted TIM-barrel fold metal-dependent hydrolase